MYHCEEHKMLMHYFSDRSTEENAYYAQKMLSMYRKRNAEASRRLSYEHYDNYDEEITEEEYWTGL